jgi:hypothetical protein
MTLGLRFHRPAEPLIVAQVQCIHDDGAVADRRLHVGDAVGIAGNELDAGDRLLVGAPHAAHLPARRHERLRRILPDMPVDPQHRNRLVQAHFRLLWLDGSKLSHA